MPVPSFGPGGLLPEGGHRATLTEVKAALVDDFTRSATRTAIFTWFTQYRRNLRELVKVRRTWLDGSFTTDKVDPADVDVVAEIDGASFDALPHHRQLLVRSLIEGTYTEEFWQCDSQPLVWYPKGHPGHSKYQLTAERWRHYYGWTRDGKPKGWVEIR